jgi:DNA-binding MarR family transcriptional regulator
LARQRNAIAADARHHLGYSPGMAGSQIARRRASEPTATAVTPSLGSAMVAICRLAEIALGETELSFTQYRILQHLQLGRTMQSDLAFHLAVSKQSVTRLVDTLVAKRYLTRKVDPLDRRRVIHAITAKGERALARTDAVLEKYLMLILQDLDDDADIAAGKAGLTLFGSAARKSYQRVGPHAIVPGRLSANLPPSQRPNITLR